MKYTAEDQYLNLMRRITEEGIWIANERTGKRCLTVINADIEIDVGGGDFPLVTTRKSYWKSAIAEIVGYVRGYTSAADFRKLGTKTWDANANENEDWLANPHRKGEDDMGLVYGAIGNNFPVYETPIERYNNGLTDTPPKTIDLLDKVYQNLKQGKDDRREIWTFMHPGMFHLGCLRPCVHTHTFSVLGDTLYLTSYQASCDVSLGLNFNMVQVYTLLAMMAQITGLKPGKAYLKIVNAHIYEDQLDNVHVQLERTPFPGPKFYLSPAIKTLDDLRTSFVLSDVSVLGYESHPPIKYAFSV